MRLVQLQLSTVWTVNACAKLGVESALAVGFWIPKLRIATAALGVAFHLSLRRVLTIGWFDWSCMLLYLAFLLPFARHPGGPGLVRPMDAAGDRRGGREPRFDTFPCDTFP